MQWTGQDCPAPPQNWLRVMDRRSTGILVFQLLDLLAHVVAALTCKTMLSLANIGRRSPTRRTSRRLDPYPTLESGGRDHVLPHGVWDKTIVWRARTRPDFPGRLPWLLDPGRKECVRPTGLNVCGLGRKRKRMSPACRTLVRYLCEMSSIVNMTMLHVGSDMQIGLNIACKDSRPDDTPVVQQMHADWDELASILLPRLRVLHVKGRIHGASLDWLRRCDNMEELSIHPNNDFRTCTWKYEHLLRLCDTHLAGMTRLRKLELCGWEVALKGLILPASLPSYVRQTLRQTLGLNPGRGVPPLSVALGYAVRRYWNQFRDVEVDGGIGVSPRFFLHARDDQWQWHIRRSTPPWPLRNIASIVHSRWATCRPLTALADPPLRSWVEKVPPTLLEKRQQIFVKVGGRTVTLDTKCYDTIDNVKKQLENLEGYPVHTQRLMYGTKKLEGRRTLASYKIKTESDLDLFLDLLGEGRKSSGCGPKPLKRNFAPPSLPPLFQPEPLPTPPSFTLPTPPSAAEPPAVISINDRAAETIALATIATVTEMDIFVKGPWDHTIKLIVTSSTTVGSVKAMVSERTNIPVSRMRRVLFGLTVLLRDSATLAFHNIDVRSTIQVVVGHGLPGGGDSPASQNRMYYRHCVPVRKTDGKYYRQKTGRTRMYYGRLPPPQNSEARPPPNPPSSMSMSEESGEEDEASGNRMYFRRPINSSSSRQRCNNCQYMLCPGCPRCDPCRLCDCDDEKGKTRSPSSENKDDMFSQERRASSEGEADQGASSGEENFADIAHPEPAEPTLECKESAVPYHVDEVIQKPPDLLTTRSIQGLQPPGMGHYPAKNATEVMWYYLNAAHSLPRDLRNDIREMVLDPDFKPADVCTEYRYLQLGKAFPILKLMANRVGLSKKELEKIAKARKARILARKQQRLLEGRSDDGESDSDDDCGDAQSTTVKVAFYDLFDILKRLLQWPGNLEQYYFLPTRSTIGGRISQTANSNIYGSLPQYTAESIWVPAVSERVGHGRDLHYTHNGVHQVGEVTGIFLLSDARSWEDVTGRAPGSLSAALDRMKTAGGGINGNPKKVLPMAFRMRPFVTMQGLKALGTVYEREGPPGAQDATELYAMFDQEHIVTPSDVTATVVIWRSRDEWEDSKKRLGQEEPVREYYSEHSVLHTTEQAAPSSRVTHHFTTFESDALPKPLYRLFDSVKLKQNLRRKVANVPVLRVFLVYFFDSFGIFSKAFHSTGAGYCTLGGLPRHLQDLLRNLVPVHLVPPGADLRAAFEPFLSRLRQLEEGVYLDLGPKIGWVFCIGGLALIRADMPQGHDFAGCLRQNAIRGCRQCKQKKDKFNEVLSPLEVAAIVRTFHGTQALRRSAAEQANGSEKARKKLLGEQGLGASAGPLEGVMFDPFRQMPYEPMHAEKLGLAKKLLNSFFSSLNPAAHSDLNDRLVAFPKVHPWSSRMSAVQLTSTKKHADAKVKMNATDAGKICGVLGLVLRGWINASDFRPAFVKKMTRQFGQREWLTEVVSAVALVARSNAMILATHHTDHGSYEAMLHCVVRTAREKCAAIWPDKFNNPTVHLGSHAHAQARDQGGGINAKTGKCETKHQQVRWGVKGLNGAFTPEVQMLRVDNARQSALFMAHEGYVHLGPLFRPGPGFLSTVRGRLVRRMLSRTCSATTYAADAYGTEDRLNVAEDDEKPSRSSEEVNLDTVWAGGQSPWKHISRPPVQNVACIRLWLLLRYKCLKIATEHGLRAFRSVSLPYRPPYCREVRVNSYYTVKDATERTGCGVAFVTTIIRDTEQQFWAVLSRMVPAPAGIDEQTGLRVLQRAAEFELRLLTDVLEPRHIVHRCDTQCTTWGAGFDNGYHADFNEFLDNTSFLA
jgi:hypothetical protein